MRILIVEDDVVLGMVAAAALSDGGHQVVGPAFSTAEALALARSGEVMADLALVDINLAGQDEGITLARQLRQEFGVPALFVSGQVAAARGHRDAALGLLPKPYDLDDLLAVVAAAPLLIAGQAPAGLPDSFEVFAGCCAEGTGP